MKNGKIRIIVGWILVTLQIANWLFGLYSTNLKLWNDADDTYEYIHPTSSELSFAEWCCAFEIGKEKFVTAFTKMIDKEDNYRSLTLYEDLSIYIRESLGASEEEYNSSLLMFDLNILIGYLFCGILGIILIVFGNKAKNKEKKIESSIDNIESSAAKRSRIICIILLAVSTYFAIWNINILTIISSIFLLIFFIFYIGKNKTVLLSSAIILVAIDYLRNFFLAAYSYLLMDIDFWHYLIFLATFSAMYLVIGIVYLICGVKLYSGKEKKTCKKLNIVGIIFGVIKVIVLPAIASIITQDTPPLKSWDIPTLAFVTVLTIYIIKIPRQAEYDEIECENIPDSDEQMELQEYIEENSSESEEIDVIEEPLVEDEIIEIPQDHSSEEKEVTSQELLFCRKCGTQLLTDSIYCNRCGTKVEYL